MAASTDAVIALARFGLGARPDELKSVRSDPRGWLTAQIGRDGADQPTATPPLPDSRHGYALFTQVRQDIRAAKGDMTARQMANRPVREAFQQEALARVRLGALTPAGFRERWTLFWANHFTVSTRHAGLFTLAGPFEREAIRPHVFGRFEDLLAAASAHPAMLIYLDQVRSAGPASRVGMARGQGLNENLAREILELHTVGPDAGYSQADVTEFARALTGWSMGGERDGPQAGASLFRAALHEPGDRSILGRRYPDAGRDQAAMVLADLSRRPATARRIAQKLATHFVSDQPDPALVDRLQAAYLRSDGDLSAVARALIAAPEAWRPVQAKFKTPNDFVISSYRAAGIAPALPQQAITPLTLLGQPPFGALQPNGWSDQAADWAAPDAVVKRLSIAQALSSSSAPDDPVGAAEAVLGGWLTPATRTAVSRAESRPEAFATVLMCPEFQRR